MEKGMIKFRPGKQVYQERIATKFEKYPEFARVVHTKRNTAEINSANARLMNVV